MNPLGFPLAIQESYPFTTQLCRQPRNLSLLTSKSLWQG